MGVDAKLVGFGALQLTIEASGGCGRESRSFDVCPTFHTSPNPFQER
ncbi:hypothetical protein [Phenylobacterium sp.]